MRHPREWQNRTRWDLWAFPDPRSVCFFCQFFSHPKENCTNPERIKNGVETQHLTDNLVYACNLCKSPYPPEVMDVYFKINPLKKLTYEQQNTILKAKRQAIDITILLRTRPKQLARAYFVDSVELSECKFLETTIQIRGYERESNRIFWDFPDCLLERKAKFFPIKRHQIKEITIYQDGSIKQISLSEFERLCTSNSSI